MAESLRGWRHRRRRANTVSCDVAVISSDSPLQDPPGDVSADQELHVAASFHDTPKPGEPSCPVKTEIDETLPDNTEAASGVDIPLCEAEEDVPGSVSSDPKGVSSSTKNHDASDNLQDDSDPDWSEHDSIAPTVVDTTDVPIVGILDESTSHAQVSPVSALPLTPVAPDKEPWSSLLRSHSPWSIVHPYPRPGSCPGSPPWQPPSPSHSLRPSGK